jgi:hypothetical protein
MKNIFILIILLSFINSNSQTTITTKAKFTNIFEFANIHDYTQKERDTLVVTNKNIANLPENLILSSLANNPESSIKLLTKFIVTYNNETHTYIKYNLVNKNEPPKLEIIDIQMNTNKWEQNKFENLIFIPIKKILQFSNANILFEFYNKDDNSSYPEINKLKSLIKDDNNVLDIYKLADIIEKNKVSLTKYLGE